MNENKNQKKIIKWIFIAIAIGISILTTPIYMPQAKEKTTEITSNILVNNLNMVMDKVSYNPETKDMEAVFYIETNDGKTPELTDLLNLVYKVDVVSKINNLQYKPKVVKVNEQYFIIQIPNVPDQYEFMRFDITPEMKNTESINSYQSLRFYYDQKKVVTNHSLNLKDREGYLSDFIYFKREQINKEIKKMQKDIKEKQEEVAKNKEMIETLKEEMLYQIEEEQTTTKGTIESLNNKNQSLDLEVDQLEKEIDKQEQKKEFINEKYGNESEE